MRHKYKKFWRVTSNDVLKVVAIVEKHKRHDEFQKRKKRNILSVAKKPNKNAVWKTILQCALTSQQKSGEKSRIRDFISSKRPVFNYQYCVQKGYRVESI